MPDEKLVRNVAIHQLNQELHGVITSSQKWSLLPLVLTAGFPALGMAGFDEGFVGVGLKLETWLLISAIGGALSGLMIAPHARYWYVGILPGLLAGPAVLLATYFYAQQREQMWYAELVIPIIGGALPSGLLYYYIMRSLYIRDALHQAAHLGEQETAQGPGQASS